MDITEKVFAACREMGDGVVQSPSLCVLDSISAIEALSPRVDSGMRFTSEEKANLADPKCIADPGAVMFRLYSHLLCGRGLAAVFEFIFRPSGFAQIVCAGAVRCASDILRVVCYLPIAAQDDFYNDSGMFDLFLPFSTDWMLTDYQNERLQVELIECDNVFAQVFAYLFKCVAICWPEEKKPLSYQFEHVYPISTSFTLLDIPIAFNNVEDGEISYFKNCELNSTAMLLKEAVNKACLVVLPNQLDFSYGICLNANKRSFNGCPPRCLPIPTHAEATSVWIGFADSIIQISRLCMDFDVLIEQLESITHSVNCGAITRALLFNSIMTDDYLFGINVKKLVTDWLFGFCGSSISEEHLSVFLNLVCPCVLLMIGIFKYSTGRQRRQAIKIVQQMDIIQPKVQGIDKSIYFTLWFVHLKLTLMRKILLWGFEDGLYAKFEYCNVYKYQIYLLECHINIMNNASLIKNGKTKRMAIKAHEEKEKVINLYKDCCNDPAMCCEDELLFNQRFNGLFCESYPFKLDHTVNSLSMKLNLMSL